MHWIYLFAIVGMNALISRIKVKYLKRYVFLKIPSLKSPHAFLQNCEFNVRAVFRHKNYFWIYEGGRHTLTHTHHYGKKRTEEMAINWMDTLTTKKMESESPFPNVEIRYSIHGAHCAERTFEAVSDTDHRSHSMSQCLWGKKTRVQLNALLAFIDT